MNRGANKISTLNPFKNIDFAQKMDSMNFNQFCNSTSFGTAECKGILESGIRAVIGLELKQMNSLYKLMYIQSGGSIERLFLTEKGCAQEKRVKGELK